MMISASCTAGSWTRDRATCCMPTAMRASRKTLRFGRRSNSSTVTGRNSFVSKAEPPLPIAGDSPHIPPMARKSDDKTAPDAAPGFGEAPQAEFVGAPLTGPGSGWAEEIAREAAKAAPPTKPKKKIPERSSAPTRTARGTSMGGAASPKERVAAGLNPVAGLDIALEDVGGLTSSGITATVAALSRLIEGGDPNLKKEAWVP